MTRALFTLLALSATLASGCLEAEDVPFAASPDRATFARTCSGPQPAAGELRGLVYSLPRETRSLPAFATLDPVGEICTSGLAVTERNGYPGFPGLPERFEWFGIDFRGGFLVAQAGTFHFRLTSDDGSRLFIDGAPVIDNDGFHWTRAREGAVSLAAGPHTIDVPYWQGPGPMALVLEVASPGEPYGLFSAGRPLGPGVEAPLVSP
ncbi:MAG TPA: PA14 domain-containing protein [Polyangiaceae bacterium]|jgi:hypothetical protein